MPRSVHYSFFLNSYIVKIKIRDKRKKVGVDMFIVHVTIDVKQEYVESFKEASKQNVQCSRKEPGVARFELLQSNEVSTKFMLVEQYRSQKDQLAHRETSHYAIWKKTITDMLEKPYTFSLWENEAPSDDEW